MELRQLAAVEAVARLRHFTRAAEELQLAQSAVSHQIRRLERELGVTLFERTSRRVVPTDAGLAIAERARRVAAEIDGVRQEIDEFQGVLRGRVWIGPLVPAGDIDVPGLLARFSHAHPGIEIGLREGVAADMFGRLATDELDVAFTLLAEEPSSEFIVERLGHEDVVVAFSPERSPLGGQTSIAPAELAGHTLVAPRRGSAICSALEDRFVAAGMPLRLALESGDPFLLRALASRGFAAAVLPRSLTALEGSPPLDVRSLRPAARLPVAIAWRRARPLSPVARAFVDFVRGQVAAAGGPRTSTL